MLYCGLDLLSTWLNTNGEHPNQSRVRVVIVWKLQLKHIVQYQRLPRTPRLAGVVLATKRALNHALATHDQDLPKSPKGVDSFSIQPRIPNRRDHH